MKMATTEDRQKVQKFYEHLRAQLEELTWLSPEPNDPNDAKIFSGKRSFHTPAIYPTISPLCQREWDLKEHALPHCVRRLFPDTPSKLPPKASYREPTQHTKKRFERPGNTFC
jgi:hypothetical protein